MGVQKSNMADTFAKYHCNYCEEDINGLRVRCLECEDFDLCLQVRSRDQITTPRLPNLIETFSCFDRKNKCYDYMLK